VSDAAIDWATADKIEEKVWLVQCHLGLLADAFCAHRPAGKQADVDPEHLSWVLGDLAERCEQIRALLAPGSKAREVAP